MIPQGKLGDQFTAINHIETTIYVPQGGDEGQKNRIINNERLETAAMSGFPANIFLAILVIVFVGAGNTQTCDKKIDLAIILDASASIGEDTFDLAKEFAKTLLRRFAISPDNTRVCIVAYSQYVNIQSRFSDDQDEGKLEEILGNTLYEGSSTGTGKTMQAVNFEVFSAKSGSRIGNPDAKQVTVVVTDGFSRLGLEFVKTKVDRIKARGIEMFSIGITKKMNDEELTALSSDPVKNHLLRLTDSRSVKGIVDHIVKEICK